MATRARSTLGFAAGWAAAARGASAYLTLLPDDARVLEPSLVRALAAEIVRLFEADRGSWFQ